MIDRPFNVSVRNLANYDSDTNCLTESLQELPDVALFLFDVRNFASSKPQRRNIHETVRNGSNPCLCSFGFSFRGRGANWWFRAATTTASR
jgi:hypothetical protein